MSQYFALLPFIQFRSAINLRVVTWCSENSLNWVLYFVNSWWTYIHLNLFQSKCYFCNVRNWDYGTKRVLMSLVRKHCQRHNGPEGWVHITSSNTNLDQISSSESPQSINFKILTKHQPLHKTWASKSWPNLASESRPRFNLDSTFYKTSAEKTDRAPASNLAWTSTSKFWPNLVLKVSTKG